jgi:hypothetical protein
VPAVTGLMPVRPVGGVRTDQRDLEPGPQVRGYVPGGEGAEAGGDAVHRYRPGGELVDVRPGRGHRLVRLLAQHDIGAGSGHGDDGLEGQRLRADGHDRPWRVP